DSGPEHGAVALLMASHTQELGMVAAPSANIGGEEYLSWGRYPRAEALSVFRPEWTDEVPSILRAPTAAPLLPYGKGRSYGDSCLNDGGHLGGCSRLNRFIAADFEQGWVRCEGGLTFADLLEFIVPRRWFLPVTPGTKFVTVGGAIANDVHGKNHHRAGTFG